jgi:hypothetical protein
MVNFHAIRFYALVLLILQLPLAIADDRPQVPIEGGFGFFLGDVYSLSPEVKLRTGAWGLLSVEVQPPTPNNTFLLYTLTLTPKTKRISEIRAHRLISNKDVCESSAIAIRKTLEDKYGPSENLYNRDVLYSIDKVNRTVVVSWCPSSEGAYDLSVIYFDKNIYDQGKQEALDIASENQDKTGL